MNASRFPIFPAGTEAHRAVETVTRHFRVSDNFQIRAKIELFLHQIARALGALTEGNVDIDKLKGLTVVDIGCGNKNAMQSATGIRFAKELAIERQWEPWLCRLMQSLECSVTGVDLETPQAGLLKARMKRDWQAGMPVKVETGWTLVKHDLTKTGALSFLPTEKVDLAVCQKVIGAEADYDDDPRMMMLKMTQRSEYNRTRAEIALQVARALKPDGTFIWNDQRWVKTPSQFSPVESIPFFI